MFPLGSHVDRLGTISLTQLLSSFVKSELYSAKERTSFFQTRRDKPKLKKRIAPRVHPKTLSALEAVSRIKGLVRSRLNIGWKAIALADKPKAGEISELKGVVNTLKLCISGVADLAKPQFCLATCPKCSHQGLAQMSPPTKEELSPTFLDNLVRTLLPRNQSFSEVSSEVKQSAEPQREEGFELQKPEQKMNLYDISSIHPNQSQVDSFENASIIKNQQRRPKREQVSFDCISDNTRVRRSVLDKEFSPSTNATLRVPRLNISDLLPAKTKRYTSTKPLKHALRTKSGTGPETPICQRERFKAIQCQTTLEELFLSRLRWTFDMIFLSRSKPNQVKSHVFEFSGELNCPSAVVDQLASTFGMNYLSELDGCESINIEQSLHFIERQTAGYDN